MSAISLKSITGITSITTPAGVDNQLTLHNNNTTEAVKLDVAGNLHFHNHLNITGVSTASNFKTGTSNLHNTGLNVQDLDVDGHTNLDNVSIAGVSTFNGDITGAAGVDLNLDSTLGSGANTAYSGFDGRLVFDTSYSDTARGPNKIQLQNASNTWIGGFGISANTLDIYTGGVTAFRRSTGTNTYTTQLTIDHEGNLSPSGDVRLTSSAGSNSSTAVVNSAWSRLEFDTDYSDTARGPNKIVLQQEGSWFGGFGISSNSMDVYTGGILHLYGKTNTADAANIETLAKFITDGAVELYHNGTKRFETTSNGILINGAANLENDGSNITVGGLGINETIFHRGDANTAMDFFTDTINFRTAGANRLRIQSTGVVNIGDTTASSLNDRLLQIGKTDRSATYLELRSSTSGVVGLVLSDGTSGDAGYRGTIEYTHNDDNMFFKTAATERLRINNEGAISVQSVLTGNTALAYLKNGRTRASGNKYGIEFRDSNNEANANIVIQQNASGNNAAHMSFYLNGGTGGNGLENGNHTLKLQQSGDIEIPTGNLNFRTLNSSPAQAAPASINMGGTHSNAAGNGTNLNAKLKVWSDGNEMMGLSVSSNQLDFIVTNTDYDYVWYSGNSGTTEMMRLEGSGNLSLFNGNKLNIHAASIPETHALINLGYDGGTNVETRAIDIDGGWSGGESKSISFTHGTLATQLVGQINSVHNGPGSSLRFGKLYHGADSSSYTMTLDSTSTSTADLNLAGRYRSSIHPAFSVSAQGGQSNIGTTATKITYHASGTGVRNQANCYDTTNHRFVAPVDGMYSFYARHWFTTGQTGTIWLYFYRNGSPMKESRMSISSAPSEYYNVQLTSTVFLSATNYIEVYGVSSSGSIFHVSSGSFHTEFSGFMVC